MRFFKWVFVGLLLLLVCIGSLTWLADTEFGHRKIVAQIEKQAPKSGLKIKIGELSGSIYNTPQVRGVELSDPEGRFLTAEQLSFNWNPMDLFEAGLSFDRVKIPSATLWRVPKFSKSADGGSGFPDRQIRIESFEIGLLRLAKSVAGREQSAGAKGSLVIADKRLKLKTDIIGTQRDFAHVDFVIEPKANVFDIAADINAPKDGLIAAITGIKRPLAIKISGDGNWQDWNGQLVATADGHQAADVVLAAQSGEYHASGRLLPMPFLTGRLQKIAGKIVRFDTRFAVDDNRFASGSLSAAASAFNLNAVGGIDFGQSAFRQVDVKARIIQPTAFINTLQASALRVEGTLDGVFKSPQFAYRLNAQRLVIGTTGLETVSVDGVAKFGAKPLRLPIDLSVARMTGIGDEAGAIMTNVRAAGSLTASGRQLHGEGIALATNMMSGKLDLLVDLANGNYRVGIDGRLPGYRVPGLGIVDLDAKLVATPANNRKGFVARGPATGVVKRLDNEFLRTLGGGVPRVTADIDRAADGAVAFRGFRMTAPLLSLAGNGVRLRDGTFQIEATGRHARYGPASMNLRGRIEKPDIDLVLGNPYPSLGLAGVDLKLRPGASGFDFAANGRSDGGAFTARGSLLIAASTPFTVQVDDLNLSGLHGHGTLRPVGDRIEGDLAVNGNGWDGVLEFSPLRNAQRIRINVNGKNARIYGTTGLSAERLAIDGDVYLDARGPTIDATIAGE